MCGIWRVKIRLEKRNTSIMPGLNRSDVQFAVCDNWPEGSRPARSRTKCNKQRDRGHVIKTSECKRQLFADKRNSSDFLWGDARPDVHVTAPSAVTASPRHSDDPVRCSGTSWSLSSRSFDFPVFFFYIIERQFRDQIENLCGTRKGADATPSPISY